MVALVDFILYTFNPLHRACSCTSISSASQRVDFKTLKRAEGNRNRGLKEPISDMLTPTDLLNGNMFNYTLSIVERLNIRLIASRRSRVEQKKNEKKKKKVKSVLFKSSFYVSHDRQKETNEKKKLRREDLDRVPKEKKKKRKMQFAFRYFFRRKCT